MSDLFENHIVGVPMRRLIVLLFPLQESLSISHKPMILRNYDLSRTKKKVHIKIHIILKTCPCNNIVVVVLLFFLRCKKFFENIY